MQLKISEVEFDPGSVIDPAGVVFHYDDRVFRAIAGEYAPIYRRLLQSDSIEAIFDAGLIETWIPEIELEGFELVVEHQRVAFLSRWTEWCSSMIQDATAAVCRLNLELCKHGYVTKDTQPGNVQFINGKAYWIDFGSVVPLARIGEFPFAEFRYHSVLPLWLMSEGYHELGRRVYAEVGRGYLKQLSTRRPFRWIPPRYALIRQKVRGGEILKALEQLLEYTEDLSVDPKQSSWRSYGQGGMPPVDQPAQFGKKASAVHRLLRGIAPGTLLDVAANKGWYARLAASMGHEVAAFDVDDGCICDLYGEVAAKESPILPLMLDFRYPTAPYSIGLGKASAFDRLGSDTVLVLALVHHLVFKQQMYFEPIARIVSKYTKRQALIEFVPKEDRYVREWFEPRYHWYSLENFVETLGRYFSVIEVHESSPDPRKLLLCSK